MSGQLLRPNTGPGTPPGRRAPRSPPAFVLLASSVTILLISLYFFKKTMAKIPDAASCLKLSVHVQTEGVDPEPRRVLQRDSVVQTTFVFKWWWAKPAVVDSHQESDFWHSTTGREFGSE